MEWGEAALTHATEPEQGRQTEVVIYHTPGCGRCRAAQEFFLARGYEVRMLDVAGDMAALRQMARKARGNRSVPVIEFGQEVVVGFDQAYWLERLAGVS
jgi:glutaredoxin